MDSMKIYISGISGTGMGPLALMAKKAGFEVCGSDLSAGAIMPELKKAGIEVEVGKQDGKYLKRKIEEGIDWFVYTSALPNNHPELVVAREAGVKLSKRDDFTEFLVEKLKLKMVAVAGTHGKTTTTSMIVYAAIQLGLPVSYIAGTTLGFAPSGAYHEGDKYFVYEADEYDRNFLKYHPWLAVLPSVSYDHPDIYATREEYLKAFEQFKDQSEKIIEDTGKGLKWQNTLEPTYRADDFEVAGEVRRKDAALAANAIIEMMVDNSKVSGKELSVDTLNIIDILNGFPGVGRRFEKLAEGIYTDYAHHPEEIEATIKIAREEARIDEKNNVIVVYQPHQNKRQHEVRKYYQEAFKGADKVYWLPTYLVRDDESNLPILTPEELISDIHDKDKIEIADTNEGLFKKIVEHAENGDLVVLMTAGPADVWLREKLDKDS